MTRTIPRKRWLTLALALLLALAVAVPALAGSWHRFGPINQWQDFDTAVYSRPMSVDPGSDGKIDVNVKMDFVKCAPLGVNVRLQRFDDPWHWWGEWVDVAGVNRNTDCSLTTSNAWFLDIPSTSGDIWRTRIAQRGSSWNGPPETNLYRTVRTRGTNIDECSVVGNQNAPYC